MRYYNYALYASAEQIKEKTTINLREYAYENPIAAVNNYMYKRLDNDVAFLAYREEGNTIFAVFIYDEKRKNFADAFAHATKVLKEDFSVNRIKTDPYEVTMYQALDFILEARRRDFSNITTGFIEASNLWIYNYYNNEKISFHYNFEERVVSDKSSCANAIYDPIFIHELTNIEEHENVSGFKGNMVHYVISGRSHEAVKDMTETLMQSLIRAKRISSRRMEVISEIEPDVYLVQNHLNDIIEGNYGGVVVLDLTEKFGCDPVDYTLTSKYIVNLLKEYRNKCLFVFTYNMDNPGFSYQILPQIKKYVIPVMLREGRGDRRAAIRYMKALIKDSAYAEYAGQAGEFMKLYPGNDFTQTDVLMAYEQFEAWCLNKNVLHAYNYDLSQDFMLDRDEVIVILAGYNERMHDFMKINEGLKSRIPHWIDFPDYTADELTNIFKLMIRERGFRVTDEAIKEAHYILEKVRNDNFGNGRYVRNLINRALQNQAVRLLSDGKDASVIKKDELFLITKNDISMLEEGLKKERKPGTAKKELDNMIGLVSVKEIIHKAIAHYKLNKLCIDKGIAREKASLHMVFTGNPGTAKTTVARLFAEIMKDEKVLSTGTFVEVGRADLVGDHVGSTAQLVKKKFKEAQGGVLFIDEAYALCDSYENGFGDEAINTLVQEMENHRDDVIVIFAGYTEPMQKFLDRNPGMLSRIAFQVKFEDYTTDELCSITKLMLSKKQMTITDAAMNKLRKNFDIVHEESDYGNGRFVRKTLEEAEMNLAERILQFKESEITTELITTIEECDIPDLCTRNKTIRQIGFAC